MTAYKFEVEHMFDESASAIETMFIEAEDVQKVKYYFHKHYRQFGWNPSWATNKHTIDIGSSAVEIHNIKEIADPIKAKVLEEELFKFPKD